MAEDDVDGTETLSEELTLLVDELRSLLVDTVVVALAVMGPTTEEEVLAEGAGK